MPALQSAKIPIRDWNQRRIFICWRDFYCNQLKSLLGIETFSSVVITYLAELQSAKIPIRDWNKRLITTTATRIVLQSAKIPIRDWNRVRP